MVCTSDVAIANCPGWRAFSHVHDSHWRRIHIRYWHSQVCRWGLWVGGTTVNHFLLWPIIDVQSSVNQILNSRCRTTCQSHFDSTNHPPHIWLLGSSTGKALARLNVVEIFAVRLFNMLLYQVLFFHARKELCWVTRCAHWCPFIRLFLSFDDQMMLVAFSSWLSLPTPDEMIAWSTSSQRGDRTRRRFDRKSTYQANIKRCWNFSL